MMRSLWTAASGMQAMQMNIDVTSNNLANVSTTGFKKSRAEFEDLMYQTLKIAGAANAAGDRIPTGLQVGMGVRPVTVHKEFTTGAFQNTGNPLDLAIEGEGFFLVETPDGVRLTRAGAFTPSAEGELMNSDGHRLLDEGQAPIIIPGGASAVAVGQDGTLSANGVPFGRVGVFAPPEGQTPTREGGTLFRIDGAPEPLETTGIRQGFLEDSNVDAVFEITRMIEVQRAYEIGQTLLDREDKRIRDAITALTR